MATLTILLDEKKLNQVQHLASEMGIPVEELVARSIDAFCAQSQESEDIEVRAMYPQLVKTFGPAGWDDPEMDNYNVLDPRRQP